jgi:ATP-dependent RNA helicase RhlE
MFLTDPATVSVSPVSSTAENVEQRLFLLKRVKETYYTT